MTASSLKQAWPEAAPHLTPEQQALADTFTRVGLLPVKVPGTLTLAEAFFVLAEAVFFGAAFRAGALAAGALPPTCSTARSGGGAAGAVVATASAIVAAFTVASA